MKMPESAWPLVAETDQTMESTATRKKIRIYHNRRVFLRWSLLGLVAGSLILGLFTGGDINWNTSTRIEIAAGATLLVLFVLSFVLDQVWTRCPGCNTSFHKPMKEFDEGLALFNSLSKCPFCKLELPDDRKTQTTP